MASKKSIQQAAVMVGDTVMVHSTRCNFRTLAQVVTVTDTSITVDVMGTARIFGRVSGIQFSGPLRVTVLDVDQE